MRRILEIIALITIVVLLLGGGAVLPVAATPDVTVSIDAPDEAAPDSDFTASVIISQVVDFDACNYDVSFDASVLRLDNVTLGLIGATTIPVDFYNQISPGTYRVVQNIPGLAGVSGSGYLGVLHFYVIGSGGSSPISLSGGVLANNLAEEIAATWVGDSVRVVVVLATTPPTIASPPPEAVAPNTTATPSAQPIKWPVLWGVIGVAIAVGLIVFLRARRKAY